jgi:hypothetical protein
MSKPLTFISVIRLINMIPKDAGINEGAFTYYVDRFCEWLNSNGYETDLKILKEYVRARNGEDIAMAVMDDENGINGN